MSIFVSLIWETGRRRARQDIAFSLPSIKRICSTLDGPITFIQDRDIHLVDFAMTDSDACTALLVRNRRYDF